LLQLIFIRRSILAKIPFFINSEKGQEKNYLKIIFSYSITIRYPSN